MFFLHSPYFWFIAIAVVVVAIVFTIRSRNSKPRGFKDFVKNPDYWDVAAQTHEDLDAAIKEAQKWDSEEVESTVRWFVLDVASSPDAWPESRILQELGERTHAAVLTLLNDRSLYDRLVKPTGENIVSEAPFNRACDLLGDSPPPEAVSAVVPFLKDPSEEVRRDAAQVVGKTGDSTIAPHIRSTFKDSDEYVRFGALNGLLYALEGKGLPEECALALFPDVQRLLEEDKNADQAARVLLGLDEARATDFFLSPSVLSADSPIVHRTLKTLADAKVAVPREELLALIESLESDALKYPQAYSLGEALRLLGRHQLSEDRELLEARLQHAEDEVAEGAAAGLLCSHGLEEEPTEILKAIWDAEETAGYDSLSTPQRFYSAVMICDTDIKNGGLAQYFVNSSGDRWKDALAGFEAAGSTDKLCVFREALALFGPGGPSPDRRERQEQLAKHFKRNDTMFDDLESRFFASPENVEVLVTRLVLANPESFR